MRVRGSELINSGPNVISAVSFALVYPQRFYFVNSEGMISAPEFRVVNSELLDIPTEGEFSLFIPTSDIPTLYFSREELIEFVNSSSDMIVVSDYLTLPLNTLTYEVVDSRDVIEMVGYLASNDVTHFDLAHSLTLDSELMIISLVSALSKEPVPDSTDLVFQCVVTGDYLDIILALPQVTVTSVSVRYCIMVNNLDYLSTLLRGFDPNHGGLFRPLISTAVEYNNEDAVRMILSNTQVYIPPDLTSDNDSIASVLDKYREMQQQLVSECKFDPISQESIPDDKKLGWEEDGVVQCFNEDYLAEWVAARKSFNPVTRRPIPTYILLRLVRPLTIRVVDNDSTVYFRDTFPKKMTIGNLVGYLWSKLGISGEERAFNALYLSGQLLTSIDPSMTIEHLPETVTVTIVRLSEPTDLTVIDRWLGERQ